MSLGATDTSVCATSWLRSIFATIGGVASPGGVLLTVKQ